MLRLLVVVTLFHSAATLNAQSTRDPIAIEGISLGMPWESLRAFVDSAEWEFVATEVDTSAKSLRTRARVAIRRSNPGVDVTARTRCARPLCLGAVEMSMTLYRGRIGQIGAYLDDSARSPARDPSTSARRLEIHARTLKALDKALHGRARVTRDTLLVKTWSMTGSSEGVQISLSAARFFGWVYGPIVVLGDQAMIEKYERDFPGAPAAKILTLPPKYEPPGR